MNYEPTNWKDGDLVTSAKLNKLEQGVANGGGSVFMIDLQENGPHSYTSLVTYEEIEEACKDQMPVARIIVGPGEGYFEATYMQVMGVGADPETSEYGFSVFTPMGMIQLVTDSPSGYPTSRDTPK